jgi:hypothetical protein
MAWVNLLCLNGLQAGVRIALELVVQVQVARYASRTARVQTLPL